MIVVNKIIIMACLLCWSVYAQADASSKLNEQQKRILSLSFKKMDLAFDVLDNKISQCHDSSYKNKLPKSLFRSHKLTLEQWKFVLQYFDIKSQRQCQGAGVWGNAVIALSQFKKIEKHFSGKNIEDTRYSYDFLCCALWEHELTLELQYFDLSAKVRKKLQNIVELTRPFSAIDAIKNLETVFNVEASNRRK